MPKKYTCMACDYESDKLFNYKKHMNSKSHKIVTATNSDTEDQKNWAEIGLNSTKYGPTLMSTEIIEQNEVVCKYCSKSICRAKNLKNHYEICKQKIKYDMEIQNKVFKEECERLKNELNAKDEMISVLHKAKQEIEEERKTLSSELIKQSKQLIKQLQNDKLNYSIINNITNNVRLDIGYIDKNCKPLDFKEVMAIELDENEKEYLTKHSHIDGPYQILYDRCIKDVPFEKRSFHLLDAARSKYYVFYDGSWKVDKGGETILHEIVLKVTDFYTESKTTLVDFSFKNKGLNADKSKILKYLADDILLKNNEQIMKKAIKLISLENK